jgi:mono/diheme cytochrome c family protein
VMTREDFDAQLAELARGPAAGGGGGGGGGGETDGETLFTDAAQPQACDSCHTLADAGATGTTGPDLDKVLADLSEEQIRESIVEPDAEVTEGFAPGLMPRYGDTLSQEQVDALVEYLMEVKGG